MNWAIERRSSVTSTMDVAREKARAGAPDGTVIVADEMTKGRGTKGRPWHAPKGGLYLSLVIRDVKDPHLLTLALGNAVADALEVAGVEPRLKWVNDVLVDGKKIAGILVEGEATGAEFDFLVAGIGINVNGPSSGLGLGDAALTLKDALGCESCIPDLETLLLHDVGKWLRKVRAGRDADIVAAFRARDALVGRKVRVESGGASIDGIADGIDDRGHLRVKTARGVKTALTGSVTILG